jgi:hypothetical protein
MRIQSLLAFVCLAFIASHATGQEDTATDTPSVAETVNPFEIEFMPVVGGNGVTYIPTSQTGGMMGAMDEGMDSSMDSGMGMEMGGMSGMGGGSGIAESDLFRERMKIAIKRLRDAKTDAEKTQLMNFTETALQTRYDQMIEKRKTEIMQLKESIAKLEVDLERRATAKDRVVKLQMQSAVLAAEGLLDLDTTTPRDSSRRNAGMGMMGFEGN